MLLPALLGMCRAAQPPERALDFESTSGVTVHATVYSPLPRPEPAPGLILLHMAGSTREAWAPFAQLARSDGYFSISIDLRGHGETKAADGVTNPSRFQTGDWLAVLDDVLRAKEKLVDAGADPERIAVVGASMGANLALRFAERDPQIRAVVLLSPGEDYHGVGVIETMQSFRQRPVLIIAAQQDGYSARSAKKLDDIAQEYCEFRLYPGAAHGTDLLALVPVASDQVLMWLDHILGKGGPPGN